MKYRPHIDGLRTVAVVPVVLFHIHHTLAPGGYVGVDVFFVISGYLITTLLYREMLDGSYSLLGFYRRRALRIFPALVVMLLAVTLLSAVLLFPAERARAGYAIAAAAGFVSNFWFWHQSGYFAAPSEVEPLLHTWSLAVEEQFYVFFPLVLFVLVRFARRHVFGAIAAISAVSFVASVAMVNLDHPTAFYLIPFRAWELGVGSMLAVAMVEHRQPCPDRQWPAILGLAAVALAMALLTSRSVFPGWNAVAPVLGAGLLIGWGDKGVAGRLLSWGPMVFVGRLSYSLYLWHWPLIVFWKLSFGTVRGASEALAIFALSFLLAWVSTGLVERPFRTARARNARSGPVVLLGLTALAVVGISGLLSAHGIPHLRSFPPQVVAMADVANYAQTPAHVAQFRKGEGKCFIGQDVGGFAGFNPSLCATTMPGKANILLIGDSHAAQYWRSLQDALPNANVMQATASGCRPLLDTPGSGYCRELRDWVFDEFLPEHHVDAVIVAGRWREDELPFVAPTIARLFDLVDKVVVFGPMPEYNAILPRILAQSALRGDPFLPQAYLRKERFGIDERMRAVVEAAGADYVDVLAKLCEDEIRCETLTEDGTPMQFDYSHLTFDGATKLIGKVEPDLERYLSR